MRLLRHRFTQRSARIGALALLLFACACSRSPKQRAQAAPLDTATAIPAPPAPSAPNTHEQPTDAPAAGATDAPAAPDAAAPAARQTLQVVTAEQLLERVRESRGKGVLVSAWASWCGPCKRELPLLQKLAARFAPQGLSVLIVSMDEHEDREKAELFLVEHGISLKSYLAARPLAPFKTGLNPRWPGMLPASFLFDAAGRLRYFWGGEAFESEVVPVLEAFVAGKPIEGEADFAVAPGQ
jgi:cytochrome c biogenesis protein CcmG, thiol:disulfide interchange protein DsbE